MLSAALLFSIGGLFIKMVPWSSLAISGGRGLLSAMVLFVFMKLTKKRVIVNRGTLLGAVCVFATTTLFIVADKLTTAANAILIQYVAPVFIILFMWAFFKERPRRLDVITCVLVLGGIACFFLDGLGGGNMLGNGIALISGVTMAGMYMMNKIPGGDSFSATVMGHFMAGLLGLPFLLQERDFGVQAVGCMLVLGIFQLGLAFVCFCTGIKLTAPVTASLINGLEPILNPILVAIVVKEFISPMSALGGAIVLLSITSYHVLLVRGRPVAEDLEAIMQMQEADALQAVGAQESERDS